MELSNSYAELPDHFFERIRPAGVSAPHLLLWNQALADELGLPSEWTDDRDQLAAVFAGNALLPGSSPIAMAYAGHQFGHFAPQLGDGRAHLLGELVDAEGARRDIQLKGSGRTRFSRGGDGRCALGPAVREFVMSEAMHALGVPTTRTLAVVRTGDSVVRETREPGATVARVASSHLRVGTFEFFAAQEDIAAVRLLADYSIGRHYPELRARREARYLAFLDAVIEKQITLIVEWMRVGFIHGVMNTDNTAISGETIDYGPCAMMGVFDPKTVYSSIDERGRYAFGNQPNIAAWNMARFAETLLPLIAADPEASIARVEPLIHGFGARFEKAWLAMMGRKLGLKDVGADESALIIDLLDRLEEHKLDHTVTFQRLGRSLDSPAAAASLRGDLGDAFDRWKTRLDAQGEPLAEVRARLSRNNPAVIPRNHHVEAVIRETIESGEAGAVERFLEVLRAPYQETPAAAVYQDPPADGDVNYRTFCGT